MVNRILYWFVTLPVIGKAGCLGTLGVLFACSCLFAASIPGANARIAARATATVVALQAESTQVAIDATSTSVAHITATSVAQQQASATSEALAVYATQTAVIAPTVTQQAIIDATSTVVAQETASAQAIIDATNTAIAHETAAAIQTAEAVAAEQATAIAIPTQTAAAIVAATATVEAIETTYQEIDVRALVKNPDRYIGSQLKLQGQVFTIEEDGGRTFLQMWVQIPGGSEFDREAVAVVFDGTLETVFEDSYILVYGVGNGKLEGTNAFGGSITQPLIKAEYVRY